MARSVDLFVDHGDDPHQLLVMLGKAAHGSATAGIDGRWQLRLSSDLVAHVYRHPYVDDGDLHLTRYPWVVSVRVGHEGSLMEHPATVALRMLAEELRRFRRRVLLVLDLQNRLDLGPDVEVEAAGGEATSGADAGSATPTATGVLEAAGDEAADAPSVSGTAVES
jgi:hypothetical protein